MTRFLNWLVRSDRSDRSRRTDPHDQVSPVSPVALAQFNTSDARTIFAHLLRRVAQGEEIVIARAGEPVASLVPFSRGPTRPGIVRTQLIVNDHQAPERTSLEDARGATPTRSSQAASRRGRARRD